MFHLATGNPEPEEEKESKFHPALGYIKPGEGPK